MLDTRVKPNFKKFESELEKLIALNHWDIEIDIFFKTIAKNFYKMKQVTIDQKILITNKQNYEINTNLEYILKQFEYCSTNDFARLITDFHFIVNQFLRLSFKNLKRHPKWEISPLLATDYCLLTDGSLSTIKCLSYIKWNGRIIEKPFGVNPKSMIIKETCYQCFRASIGEGYKLCKNREFIIEKHYHWVFFDSHSC